MYQNAEICSYILDNNKINVKDIPNINSSLVKSDFKKNPNTDVSKEFKENYIDVEMPYIIQASVGGNVKIFELLVSKGADVFVVGHISLSRKKKNSFVNNILGAASFFGNVSLVKYILENKISTI